MNAGPPASTCILLGSARGDGNTTAVAQRLSTALGGGSRIVDLGALAIAPYRYGAPLDRDDFAAVVEAMLGHQRIVFATPVYWYAMSAPMKTVFDRLSDLLLDAAAQARGRALAGRTGWLLATGSDPALPAGFTEPFVRTMAFFGIGWGGEHYVHCPKAAVPDAAALASVDRFAAALSG